MGGACSTVGGRSPYRVSVGKSEGRRPLGRPNILDDWGSCVPLSLRGPYGSSLEIYVVCASTLITINRPQIRELI
jgi:hypothetical protein